MALLSGWRGVDGFGRGYGEDGGREGEIRVSGAETL